MPYPEAFETEKQFINRFMGDKEANKDYPNVSRRRAVAQSIWDRRLKPSSPLKIIKKKKE